MGLLFVLKYGTFSNPLVSKPGYTLSSLMADSVSATYIYLLEGLE